MIRPQNAWHRRVRKIVPMAMLTLFLLCSEKATSSIFGGGENDELFYKGDKDAEPFISEFFLPTGIFAKLTTSYPKEFESVSQPASMLINTEDVPYKPYFLFSRENGFRIVEFYAQWCGHCQHYKPHYIELAKSVKEKMPNIEFYAVSCVNYHDICTTMDVQAYPTVMIFGEKSLKDIAPKVNMIITEEYIIELARSAQWKEAKKTDSDLKEKNGIVDGTSIESQLSPIKIDKIWSHEVKKEEIFSDALTSLDYSLRTGTYATIGALPLAKQEALIEWLTLLSVSIPEQWEVHSAINDLLVQIGFISMNESNLKKVLDDHELGETNWSQSCKKGVSYAGYTCGLWELFHIVSVGIVEQNNHQDDQKTSISTLHAARTLRNFVEDFFGCSECVAHFLTMYDSCSLRNCDLLTDEKSFLSEKQWTQFPLWLWQAHNDVNVRLRKEELERNSKSLTTADIIAAQWPPKQLCQDCWDVDGSYREDAVYNFLKETYWPDDNLSITSQAKPSFQNRIYFLWKEHHHKKSFSLLSVVIFLVVIMWYVIMHVKTQTCLRMLSLRLCLVIQKNFRSVFSRDSLLIYSFFRKWNLHKRDTNDSLAL